MELTKQPTAIICLSPYRGGMEMDAIKLAKKLSMYTPTVVIAKKDCFIDLERDNYVGYNNISLEVIKFSSSLSLNLILSIRKIVQEKSIKNVVFFGASELKSLYFSFLGLNINLIIRHGTTKSTPKKDFFHKLIYSEVNYHVSICEHLLQNVREIIPFGKYSKEKLIYSSIQLNQLQEYRPEKLTLLHVGRVIEGKGQVDAIKACEILYKNNIDFHFYIVGEVDKEFEEEFLAVYDSCDYKDKIEVVGFSNDVQSYIHKSNFFIFPSYGEGLSNAFLEALANNLVCIVYNNTSFPELKLIGLEFYLANNRDINDLKDTLLYAVKNYEKKKIDNFPKVEDIFSLESEINKYLEILH